MKKLTAFVGLLFLVCFQPAAIARNFNDVVYEGGYPSFQGRHAKGSLEMLGDRMAFVTPDGKKFEVPYDHVVTYQYEYEGGPGPIFGFAGPHPALMATSLGINVLSLIGSQLADRKNYKFIVEYQDDAAYTNREITFAMGNKSALKQVSAELRMKMNDYNAHQGQPETVTNPTQTVQQPLAVPTMTEVSSEDHLRQ